MTFQWSAKLLQRNCSQNECNFQKSLKFPPQKPTIQYFKLIIFISLPLAVVVFFNESLYSATEDIGSLKIVLVLSSPLSFNVTVQVEVTAAGKLVILLLVVVVMLLVFMLQVKVMNSALDHSVLHFLLEILLLRLL